MHRMTRIVAGAATIWIGLTLCSSAYLARAAPPTAERPNPPPSIERVRALAELTVLEVQSTTVVSTEINGHTGGTSVVVLVHGTLAYGVNLDTARYLRIDEEQRHLVLALPQPTARRVAIDPRMSRVLSCERTGLWRVAAGPAREDEAVTSALAIGRDRLMDASASVDLVGRARRQAESVLARFVTGMGWTLEVRWDD